MVASTNPDVDPSSLAAAFDEPRYAAQRTKLHETTTENGSELFQLIQMSNWEDAAAKLKRNPIEATLWIVKPDFDETEWRRLPLHEACVRDPTLDIVEALLEAHPNGAREPDHNGRLAIHLACCYGASLAVIDVLAMAYPKALDVADVWGKKPLSVAMASITPHRDALIDAISKGSNYYTEKSLKWSQDKELWTKQIVLEYQRKISEQEETIQLLVQKNSQDRKKLEEQSRRRKQVIGRVVEQMKEERKTFAERYELLSTGIASSQVHVNKLKLSSHKKSKKIGSLEEQLAALNIELQESKRQNEEMTVRVAKSIETSDKLAERCATLSSDLASTQLQVRALEDKIADLMTTLDRVSKERFFVVLI